MLKNQNGQICRQFVVEESADGLSIRDYVRIKLGISRKLLAEIKFQGGSLKLNGIPKIVYVTIHYGDVLDVVFPPEKTGPGIIPGTVLPEIVYEDDWCIVINKPSGLLSIPNQDPSEPSMAGRVLLYFHHQQHPATIHPVTRLDRQTSGLMMFAKDRYSHSLFMKQHSQSQLKKFYTAEVSGIFPWRWGTIIAPIARHPDSIIERAVSKEGKKAITRFELLKQNDDRSQLQLNIETGRTHQIRVHLAWLGFAIHGDSLYGDKETAGRGERMRLHASGLTWIYPENGEQISCNSSFPHHF